MIESFVTEFRRYRQIGEMAIEQVPDEGLDRVLAPDGNSIAMLVRHLHGNLSSRFTDFLTTDGEKPWRDRDGEFEEWTASRSLAHVAYHVGQIVLLARILADDDWRWISIPKGGSEQYNRSPDKEKAPRGSARHSHR